MTTTLDPSALEQVLEMAGGDRSFVVEIIDEYVQDSAGLLATLRGAHGEELRRAAHSLKSTSASVGARRLAELSAEIERGEPADADRLAAVEREHAAAVADLQAQRAAYA